MKKVVIFCSLAMCAAVIFMTFLVLKARGQHEEIRKQTYAAWVKHTGNPKEITYEEWNLLVDKKLLRP
jgi:hypothetical protein